MILHLFIPGYNSAILSFFHGIALFLQLLIQRTPNNFAKTKEIVKSAFKKIRTLVLLNICFKKISFIIKDNSQALKSYKI